MPIDLIYHKIKNTLRRLDARIEGAKYDFREHTPEKLEYFEGGLYDAVYDASCRYPHNIALEYFDTQISYKDLIKKINKVAAALKAIGAEKGENISVCMPNTPECVYMMYAINEIGAVANMIHPLSSEKEIEDYLQQAHSKIMLVIDISYFKVENIIKNTDVETLIVVSPARSMDFTVRMLYKLTKGRKNHIKTSQQVILWDQFLSKANRYIGNPHARVNSDDSALIMYTGGTTGRAKGAMLSNLNFNAQALGASYIVPELLKPGYNFLTFLPNFHAFGFGCCIHMPLYYGCTVVLIPQFSAKKLKSYIKKYHINILVGVPSMFDYLTKIKFGPRELKGIKGVVSGGDMISMATKTRINDFLADHGSKAYIGNGYGLTEASGGFIMSSRKSAHDPDGIGFPLPDDDTKIVNPKTGKVVPIGEDGEIVVHGPCVMKGYLGDPEETEKSFVKVGNKKYLKTGDIGYVDEDGLFHFRGRLKRMIITNGYNVYPSVVEDATYECKLIAACAAVGKEDKLRGQKVVVYAALKPDTSERTARKQLNAIYKKHLAKYEIPREIHFLPELPKTKLAKVDFRALEKL